MIEGLRWPFVRRSRYDEMERRESLARRQLRDYDRRIAGQAVEIVNLLADLEHYERLERVFAGALAAA